MAAVCTEDPEHILQEKPLVKPLVNDITEDEAIHALQIPTGNIWNGSGTALCTITSGLQPLCVQEEFQVKAKTTNCKESMWGNTPGRWNHMGLHLFPVSTHGD